MNGVSHHEHIFQLLIKWDHTPTFLRDWVQVLLFEVRPPEICFSSAVSCKDISSREEQTIAGQGWRPGSEQEVSRKWAGSQQEVSSWFSFSTDRSWKPNHSCGGKEVKVQEELDTLAHRFTSVPEWGACYLLACWTLHFVYFQIVCRFLL